MSTYRTGNHNARHVYRGDDEIAVAFTPEDGALIVEALNEIERMHGPALPIAVTVTEAAEHAFHRAAAAARTMPRHEGYATHDGICAALRALGIQVTLTVPSDFVADSCTCVGAFTDTQCPVHEGRKARAPRPPYLGPGCICDGSGRTCPRHGVVL